MRWIYLSPHLDDAILSCGGLIWEQTRVGTPVETWTFTCGTPPPVPLSTLARRVHADWGSASAKEIVSLRRGEDRLAARRLGVVPRHFDFLDCIYRRADTGEPLYEDIFVPPHPDDAALAEQMAAILTDELAPDDVLICPLTIGGHADHILVRQAAERLGRPLWYYADVPYLLDHPEALDGATRDMSAKLYPVSAEGLSAWLDASAAYTTQIGAL
ncbi:MAG: PIG-L family deacetylase, partial [Chloroflexi bacterium]|nr:PIG-L family deacetylase [Chloroflexota bacterium]